MVIESIDNIEVAYELANIHGIEVPIIDTVYSVIYKGLEPKDAVEKLMTRAKRKE